jgi:hypothetical protein
MDQHALLRKIPKIDDLMMQIETIEFIKAIQPAYEDSTVADRDPVTARRNPG